MNMHLKVHIWLLGLTICSSVWRRSLPLLQSRRQPFRDTVRVHYDLFVAIARPAISAPSSFDNRSESNAVRANGMATRTMAT